MTTTEIPLGIDEGKPSSRVLRPPGGGSSFSLGMDNEEPRVQKPRQCTSEAVQGSTTETPPPANKPTAPPDNTRTEGQSPAPRNNSSSHSRIFGDTDNSPHTPTGGRILAKGDPNSTANPITGQGAAKPADCAPPKSTKVRHPPGGASSGIF